MGAFDNFDPTGKKKAQAPPPTAAGPPADPSSSGAFSNFNPGGAAPAAPGAAPSDTASFNQPDTLGNMSWFDPRAANSTTKDFLLAHLAELGKGLGQMGGAASDYARTAANVYGEGDSTLASMKAVYGDLTGNTKGTDILSNLAAEKAKTAAASERLGTAGTIAASMTGGGPLGKIAEGVGTMALPAVGGNKWLAGLLGGGVTGGGSTAAGEIGRNENLSPWDIALGTLFGTASEVPGGGVGRGGKLAPPVSADDLHATAQDIYRPLDKIIFDTKGEVKPELDAFRSAIGSTTDLTGKRLGQASGTSAILEDLEGTPQLTARNIQEAQRSLDKIASSPSSSVQDQEYAPKLKSALENVMQNGLPFAGVPSNVQPSGYAAIVRNAGDIPHGMAEEVDRLNTMVDKSQTGSKPDIGAQMGAYLTSKQGLNFVKPGTPQYEAANTLADTAQKPLTSGQGLTMWDLKHHLMWPAIGLGGAGAASLVATEQGHQPAWAQIPEDAAGLAASFLLKNRLGAAGMKAQQQALDAYRTTASTGKFQAPVLPDAPFREAVRRLIFGQGAAGALPGQ